jgi:pimeloyl-ACP methyl ester carboxylesterase
VAADTPWIAGVLVGAAPGITIAEQNLYSFERALLGEGVPPHIIEGAVSLLAATYDYYQTGAGYEVLRARFDHPANAGFVNEPFFRRFLFQNGDLPPPDVDPADWRSMFVDHVQYWRAVDAPVLAMWGADDNEVPAELSRQVISDALAGHGSDDRVLVVFEDATHSLYVDSDEGEAWDWERTAPGFQESVAEWLARRR